MIYDHDAYIIFTDIKIAKCVGGTNINENIP